MSMRGKSLKLILATSLMLAMMLPASADVLLIEEVRERMQRDLPENGLTREAVEQRFGTPNERRAAVGDPPITRWVYDEFSVYFEYDLVIESVLNRGAVIGAAQ